MPHDYVTVTLQCIQAYGTIDNTWLRLQQLHSTWKPDPPHESLFMLYLILSDIVSSEGISVKSPF